MNANRNVLVGIDFSPCSAAALEQAVRIAARRGGTVTAMHVVPVPAYALSDGVTLPLEVPSLDLLVSAARESWAGWPPAKAASGVNFIAQLGAPRYELLNYANHNNFGLLIVGEHGPFAVKKTLGSVTAACVQRSEVDVLVVRESAAKPFRSVLACVDFSDISRQVVEKAIETAVLDDASLTLFHVYQNPWKWVRASPEVQGHMERFAPRYEEAVREHLESFLSSFRHELGALKADIRVCASEHHGRAILDYARDNGCDLIVCGTRAKWNLRDFLWGSTAERVVREAPCCVLAVKPPRPAATDSPAEALTAAGAM
jgi:nucleotide-binding universal stress UspA family protein